MALPAQIVPNPSEVPDPNMAEDPHIADEPHAAEGIEDNFASLAWAKVIAAVKNTTRNLFIFIRIRAPL